MDKAGFDQPTIIVHMQQLIIGSILGKVSICGLPIRSTNQLQKSVASYQNSIKVSKWPPNIAPNRFTVLNTMGKNRGAL
jgi:hypothetical protein